MYKLQTVTGKLGTEGKISKLADFDYNHLKQTDDGLDEDLYDWIELELVERGLGNSFVGKTYLNKIKKMPNLPQILISNVIYHFENTTTRNAFWEIWAEPQNENFYYSIKVRFGKIGEEGTVKTLLHNATATEINLEMRSRADLKQKSHYVYIKDVYIKEYDESNAKPTKGSMKAKQSDPKIKQIDVLEVSKAIHKRIIKVI